MSQIYRCPHCRQALSVTDDLLNTEVECPSCQNVITLTAAPIPVAAVPKPVRPIAQMAQPQFTPKINTGSTTFGKSKGSNGLLIAVVAGAIILGIGSLGAVGIVAYVMAQNGTDKDDDDGKKTSLEKEEKLLREQIAEAEKQESDLAGKAGKLTASVEALRDDLKQQSAEVDALTAERNSLTGGVP